MRYGALFAIAVGLAGSCRQTADRRAPDVEVPDRWSGASGPRADAEPPSRWWLVYGDPLLDSLVERALAANLDVAIARARVLEARALRDVAAGARLPELDGRASYNRDEFSANTPQGSFQGSDPRGLYDVGFDARWEVDLFGSNRSALAAARAGLEAAEEGRRDAIVTLLGELAREYVELRGLQRQIELTRANAEAQQETLELTRARAQAGLSTELDVARAEAQHSTTLAQIPGFQSQASAGIHRLSVLVAEAPGNLTAELGGEGAAAGPVPGLARAVEGLAAGVPSDLLRRRPDIRRAERELAEAAALTDQATADLYPKLTLGASIGLQSSHASDLGDGDSRISSIGASLLAPIFQGGRLRATVRVHDAREDQAVLLYQRTVLQALAEVENALTAVAREDERRLALQQALEASRRALELARDLHLRGLADFFEVLDAQRSQLFAETGLAQSEARLSAETVALYKALGGGWEALEPAPSPTREPEAESSGAAPP